MVIQLSPPLVGDGTLRMPEAPEGEGEYYGEEYADDEEGPTDAVEVGKDEHTASDDLESGDEGAVEDEFEIPDFSAFSIELDEPPNQQHPTTSPTDNP